MTISDFARWDVIAMCIALATVFVFEMMGVFSTKHITITELVREFMPMWMRAMILGWMCWHFMSK